MIRPLVLSVLAALACWQTALAQEVTFSVAGDNLTFDIAAEVTTGYDRDDWPHWNEHLGGACFTVRDKVLAEESFIAVTTVPASGGRCRVTEGLWRGPYTNLTFTDSGDVDIDHVVALAEAHRSGGHAWTPERKRAYANHLDYAHHLLAVDAAANRYVKSDHDPSDYLPLVVGFRCKYVEIWLTIKHIWGLNMNQDEADAISAVLAGC